MADRIDKVSEFRKEGEKFRSEIGRAYDGKLKEIVDTLKDARKERGLTQQDIADATGMKAPNINRLEKLNSKPSLELIMRYAEAMGYEVNITLRKKK